MNIDARMKKGRPDAGDLAAAINGEIAMLDTFARPVFGRRNYPKTLEAIVRHSLASDDSHATSYSDSLRIRILKVRRTHASYVSDLEVGIRSALRRLKADPLASELA